VSDYVKNFSITDLLAYDSCQQALYIKKHNTTTVTN